VSDKLQCKENVFMKLIYNWYRIKISVCSKIFRIHYIIVTYTYHMYTYYIMYVCISHTDSVKNRTNKQNKLNFSIYKNLASACLCTADLPIIQCINRWHPLLQCIHIYLKVWKGVLRILYIMNIFYIIYTYTSYYLFFYSTVLQAKI